MQAQAAWLGGVFSLSGRVAMPIPTSAGSRRQRRSPVQVGTVVPARHHDDLLLASVRSFTRLRGYRLIRFW